MEQKDKFLGEERLVPRSHRAGPLIPATRGGLLEFSDNVHLELGRLWNLLERCRTFSGGSESPSLLHWAVGSVGIWDLPGGIFPL